MKINRIELYNIGSYEGLNVFDIAAQNPNGKISVIGGKNGAGKTTLFSGIKLCLYGYREAGYQAINNWYKNSIKRLINDKAKLENKASAYVLLNLSIFNGQDWDEYELKRNWNLNEDPFEEFVVVRNGVVLTTEEIDDFDNYLLNLIPPELFELYFFDGEQIADFFLEESNGGRIKNAFLTICGYDTFDILYKNFKRMSKSADVNDSALDEFFSADEQLREAEKMLQKVDARITELTNQIEEIETELAGKEKRFISRGGVSLDEWNEKFLDLKNEERIREEKNAWLKNAANEMIPYLILRKQIVELHNRILLEEEESKKQLLESAMKELIPEALQEASYDIPELSDEVNEKLMSIILKKVGSESEGFESILNLSKDEYQKLIREIAILQGYSADEVIAVKQAIKDSIKRSQKRRDDIEASNISEVDNYLREKETLLSRKEDAVEERRVAYEEQKELQASVSKLESAYKLAEKALDKHFKGESVSNLTTRSVLFLDALQKRLFKSEIEKVQKLFMEKMNQLMRKEKFISDISIDDDFNVHVFKQVRVDSKGICERIKQTSVESYIKEYGAVHCNDILKVSGCKDFDEFIKKYAKTEKVFDVMLEFDKATMSKGEKQVFIMALYWAIMQLCNKEIPFIIDTPFARIDTIHRAHITEYFFKELSGQVLIFSTDEEITPEHMGVIGSDLQSKFLIENVDNKKTVITANKYFGE